MAASLKEAHQALAAATAALDEVNAAVTRADNERFDIISKIDALDREPAPDASSLIASIAKGGALPVSPGEASAAKRKKLEGALAQWQSVRDAANAERAERAAAVEAAQRAITNAAGLALASEYDVPAMLASIGQHLEAARRLQSELVFIADACNNADRDLVQRIDTELARCFFCSGSVRDDRLLGDIAARFAELKAAPATPPASSKRKRAAA